MASVTPIWSNFSPRGMVYLAFLGLALLVGLIAGVYPALYLSKIDPVLALSQRWRDVAAIRGKRNKLSIGIHPIHP